MCLSRVCRSGTWGSPVMKARGLVWELGFGSAASGMGPHFMARGLFFGLLFYHPVKIANLFFASAA